MTFSQNDTDGNGTEADQAGTRTDELFLLGRFQRDHMSSRNNLGREHGGDYKEPLILKK